MTLVRRRAWTLALALGVATRALADDPGSGEIPGARVILEVGPPARSGFVPEALPPRLVVFDDARVVVGGYRGLSAGRLEKDALKALERRLAQVKRLPGLGGGAVSFGAGDARHRLRLPKERLDVSATGDPENAPPELRPLAALVRDLARFDHATLAPLAATHYLALAREETLAGGCRAWRAPPALAELVAAPRVLAADAVRGWPTGAVAASVCSDGRRYSLALRPLLPGEKP